MVDSAPEHNGRLPTPWRRRRWRRWRRRRCHSSCPLLPWLSLPIAYCNCRHWEGGSGGASRPGRQVGY